MRGLVLVLAALAWSLIAMSATTDTVCQAKLELIDAATGKQLAGLVQVRDAAGKLVPLPSLLSRGFGLEPGPAIHDWWVLPGARDVSLPYGSYTLRALSGLETDVAEVSLQLDSPRVAIQVPLHRFFDAATAGQRAANTHLHLKKLSRQEADRYLLETPLGDGLDVVFLSYLERAIEDLEYTSNKYSRADLERLSHRHGTRFGNGEEHRHNFMPQNQGYGHVMLLNIPELIQPVSIGPGITKQGTDGLPLRLGIDKARSLGSTIIWCHNQWGLEDIPNWIMGRLHANNIFDGGTHGSFKHSFYRYLNAGLRVPFSTGTDWFMYDFSRVYVPADRALTAEEWLTILSQGRSWITNGPLLTFQVDAQMPGGTLICDAPREVTITAEAVGRVYFQSLQVVQNGRVVAAVECTPEAGHHRAKINRKFKVDGPCWFALRTPPPPVKGDPEFQTPVPKNELGCDLFSHTSAVFVSVAGEMPFDLAAADSLLQEMHDSRHFIEGHALFADEQERRRVLAVYDEAIAKLTEKIARVRKE